MSSSQPLGDDPTLLDATGFSFVEVSPTFPILVPFTGKLSADVIDLSTSTEPQHSFVAVPASVPVTSLPLVFSSSPVVSTILRRRHIVASPWEASVHDWERPPGLETHLDDLYSEKTAPKMAFISTSVAQQKCRG